MVASELQRDWRLPTGPAITQLFHQHNPNYSMLMDNWGRAVRRTPQAWNLSLGRFALVVALVIRADSPKTEEEGDYLPLDFADCL